MFYLTNYYLNLTDIKLSTFQQVVKGEYLGSYYEFENGCNTHPHNTHFQFLAELGLVGYAFLVVIILFILRDIFKLLFKKFRNKSELNKFEISYFICLIGILLHINPIFPSGSFFNNYNSIIFFMIASFLIYFRYKKIN